MSVNPNVAPSAKKSGPAKVNPWAKMEAPKESASTEDFPVLTVIPVSKSSRKADTISNKTGSKLSNAPAEKQARPKENLKTISTKHDQSEGLEPDQSASEENQKIMKEIKKATPKVEKAKSQKERKQEPQAEKQDSDDVSKVKLVAKTNPEPEAVEQAKGPTRQKAGKQASDTKQLEERQADGKPSVPGGRQTEGKQTEGKQVEQAHRKQGKGKQVEGKQAEAGVEGKQAEAGVEGKQAEAGVEGKQAATGVEGKQAKAGEGKQAERKHAEVKQTEEKQAEGKEVEGKQVEKKQVGKQADEQAEQPEAKQTEKYESKRELKQEKKLETYASTSATGLGSSGLAPSREEFPPLIAKQKGEKNTEAVAPLIIPQWGKTGAKPTAPTSTKPTESFALNTLKPNGKVDGNKAAVSPQKPALSSATSVPSWGNKGSGAVVASMAAVPQTSSQGLSPQPTPAQPTQSTQSNQPLTSSQPRAQPRAQPPTQSSVQVPPRADITPPVSVSIASTLPLAQEGSVDKIQHAPRKWGPSSKNTSAAPSNSISNVMVDNTAMGAPLDAAGAGSVGTASAGSVGAASAGSVDAVSAGSTGAASSSVGAASGSVGAGAGAGVVGSVGASSSKSAWGNRAEVIRVTTAPANHNAPNISLTNKETKEKEKEKEKDKDANRFTNLRTGLSSNSGLSSTGSTKGHKSASSKRFAKEDFGLSGTGNTGGVVPGGASRRKWGDRKRSDGPEDEDFHYGSHHGSHSSHGATSAAANVAMLSASLPLLETLLMEPHSPCEGIVFEKSQLLALAPNEEHEYPVPEVRSGGDVEIILAESCLLPINSLPLSPREQKARESTWYLDPKETQSPPAKILDGLFQGGKDVLKSSEYFTKNGITHVLSLGDLTPKADLTSPPLEIKQIDIADDPDAPLSNHFDEAVRFIHKARGEGKAVYVHSAAGVSRSATIIIAYVMTIYNIEFGRGFRFLADRRPMNPNKGFKEQLRRWGRNPHRGTLKKYLELIAPGHPRWEADSKEDIPPHIPPHLSGKGRSRTWGKGSTSHEY